MEFFSNESAFSHPLQYVLTKEKRKSTSFHSIVSSSSSYRRKAKEQKRETNNRDTSLLIFHATGTASLSRRKEQKTTDSKSHLATRESSMIKANRRDEHYYLETLLWLLLSLIHPFSYLIRLLLDNCRRIIKEKLISQICRKALILTKTL